MSQYTILRHASPEHNLSSILQHGISVQFSQTSKPEVWLHRPSVSCRLALHAARRHKVPGTEQMLVFEVKVRRDWLKRSRRNLWVCTRTIPPSQIVRTMYLDELI